MKAFRFFGHEEAFVARKVGVRPLVALDTTGVFHLEDGEGNTLSVTGRHTGLGGWEISIREFSAPVWGFSLDRFRGSLRLCVSALDTTVLTGPLKEGEA